MLLLTFSSCKDKSLFKSLSSDDTGIDFNNQIIETDSINVLDFENVYNGGGVGIGDFNNDGLQDVYFTGNMVQNKLYMNKGDFKFEDVTAKAGVEGLGRWCRGVAVVDINLDGLQDMYICASIKRDPASRQNLLYINQGITDGVPVFKEMAQEYGLNDTSHSTMAAFFDYDNDNDLDVYILNNEIVKGDYPNKFRPILTDGSHSGTDRLYRNDYNESLKHAVFTNVSKEAGITIEGYGHGVAISDFNRDGYKDVYVSNDYLSNNILYINNKNGTFTDRNAQYFSHASANAMGNDVVDINNDGLMDVIELDMNPEDNFRKKMMLNPNSYQTYQNSDHFGYHYQYVRNTLQLNRGERPDSAGHPVFSEISWMSGIAETDWSWTPLVIDFDNDGYRDIIVTNGFPKDVTDHDFIAFRREAFSIASKQDVLEQIPEVKIPNYAYRNNGDLTFTNVSKDWGIETPTFSNGAAYADLDNDGDMDYVVNNINDKANVHENMHRQNKKGSHFLQIKLEGDGANPGGFGAWVEINYGENQKQVYEHTPFRGYLSSVHSIAHFGVGETDTIKNIIISWPNGKSQVLKNISTNQIVEVKIKDATLEASYTMPLPGVFKEITDSLGLNIRHHEDDFIDFNVQKLLPHKLSDYGPAIAVNDLNGDGLDDMVVGGSYGYSTQLLFQQRDGKFISKNLVDSANRTSKPWEEMGILLFDADKDGDADMYISCGGNENAAEDKQYRDRFYLNDGKGNFTYNENVLPDNRVSKSCVRAADYDKDGDLDLFVGGRHMPWQYPLAVNSVIYRNDGTPGNLSFKDVTSDIAPGLQKIGLTCDMIWTDFDNDNWIDIILAGEMMPITFFKNDKGKFKDVTAATGIADIKGWWNSLAAGDFDNDGDIDYIAGNQGRNSFYRPSKEHPVRIYAKDFDNNGNFDAIPSVYLPDQKGTLREFPAHVRDDLIKQMIEMRDKFKTYKDFAIADFDQVITKDQRKDALILEANTGSSIYLENRGQGAFILRDLPVEAQISSVFGILPFDVDQDGNLDVILNGNDYGIDVSVGRYDAMHGLVLKGDGKGGFAPMQLKQAGIYIPGNGKAIAIYVNPQKQPVVVTSQNRGKLQAFSFNTPQYINRATDEELHALITTKNGKTRKQEFYSGHGFLSQSPRIVSSGNKQTVFINKKNVKRIINE